MKVGVFSILPDTLADLARVARHAEDLGFASYWIPDHTTLPVTYSTPYPGNLKPGIEPDPDYLWQMPDPGSLDRIDACCHRHHPSRGRHCSAAGAGTSSAASGQGNRVAR